MWRPMLRGKKFYSPIETSMIQYILHGFYGLVQTHGSKPNSNNSHANSKYGNTDPGPMYTHGLMCSHPLGLKSIPKMSQLIKTAES